MKKGSDKSIKEVLLLGLISGSRTTFAPAVASHFLSKKPSEQLNKSKLAFIQAPAAAVITKVLSAGEIVGDKLPFSPNRIAAPQVLARVASGAFMGAIVSRENKSDLVKGALIGGAAALAATYASFYLRKAISENTFIKEPWTGVLEDTIAIGAGVLIMK